MGRLRAWLSRVTVALGFGRRDVQIVEEMQAHLDLLTDEHVRRGLSPADARAAARREFGGTVQAREAYSDQRGLPIVETLGQDFRIAWRTLRRSPGFATSAILVLAIGIGANTAIFSLIDALVLRSLPVHEPDRLFLLSGNYAYPSFRTLQAQGDVPVDLLATNGSDDLEVHSPNQVEAESVVFVSGSYFSVLGVGAAAGRTLLPADERDGDAAPVAVVSYGFWQRRFAGASGVIGTTLEINRRPLTIVGVAPRGFFGERVGEAPDLWVPLPMRSQLVTGRDLIRSPTTAWLDLIARVPAGTDVRAVETALTHRYKQILLGAFGPNLADDERRDIERLQVSLTPAGSGLSSLREEFARPLWILMAAVVVLQLIACANVANLLLARSAARQREIGLRLALGISRGRLIRQLTTEAFVLSALGAAAGLVIGRIGREVLLSLVSDDGSRLELVVATDTRVLLFVIAFSFATALLVGLAPAWQSARVDLLTSLKAARDRTPGNGGFARTLLVAGQVALSLVLVVAAALFLTTLSNLRHVDLGFSPDRLLIADVNPRAAGYENERFQDLCRQLLDRMRVYAGMVAVSLSENGALMGRDSSTNRLWPSDLALPPAGPPKASYDVVGAGYFAAMNIRIVEGRDFDDRDREGAPAAIAINEAMARQFFGSTSVIGRRLRWDESDLTIVAVTADVRRRSPRDPAPLQFYIPYFQHPSRATLSSVRLVVRTAGEPAAMVASLRDAIQSVDARVPITRIEVTTDLVDRALARQRMVAKLATAFGLIALGVASVGLYGLIAFRVARRTSEIGLRLALGASRRQVVWMVAKHNLALVVAGAAIGLPLSIAASSLIESQLFGVGGSDPTTLALATVMLGLAAAAAAVAPTIRATRIQPVIALRHE